MFKRQSKKINPGTTCASYILFLKEVDENVIVSLVDNFVYLVVFALVVQFNNFLRQIHETENLEVSGCSMLLSIPLMQLSSIAAIYLKNSKLRYFYIRTLKHLVDHTKEKLCHGCHDVE